ncbi:hypothetical protein FNAPI_7929 [Fusarium napiforme]|uniref:Uncharacterized protein n=1 Tax=Fusarium napiforme TaxID=42672 RepID=A0A8H5J8U2_9HYPO|nr:hypothetical protein FNAPI_7929 [Fusarium napiforme]
MDNDYLRDNPWIGQQPEEADRVIDYLNSDQGIMFPAHEFVESPDTYANGIRQPLREPADADNDIPPLNLPPALDDFEVDIEEIDLDDPHVPANRPLAEDCWDFIFEPLLSALILLRGVPPFLVMPIYLLLLYLYCTVTGKDGLFFRRLFPVVLVEIAELYEPGAGFLVTAVIGLTPYILEQLPPIVLTNNQRLALRTFGITVLYAFLLILVSEFQVDKSRKWCSRNVC